VVAVVVSVSAPSFCGRFGLSNVPEDELEVGVSVLSRVRNTSD
jgi:hypothetical protein